MHLAPEKTRERDRLPGRRAEGSRTAAAPAVPGHPMLQLQEQAGNQAVQQLLRSGVIQAKLTVSNPDDPEEQEADQVAERIMRMEDKHDPFGPPCPCQLSGGELCEECKKKQAGIIACKSSNPAPRQTAASHPAIGRALRSAGQPLDSAARAFFEPRLGRDFSDVRVHTGERAADAARQIRAHAFTYGNDIYFGNGEYAPGTEHGQKLLAHELTHTAQTASSTVRRSWLGDAWDTIKEGGEWVGGEIKAGAEAVVEGAERVGHVVKEGVKWAGGEIKEGAIAVGEWAEEKFENAWDCLQAMGKGAGNLFTGNISSITDLLGIPEPSGADPSTLDTLVAVLKHPCLQMLPGYGLVAKFVGKLESVGKFLVGAWEVIQNPQPLIDGIKNSISKMISAIPAKVDSLVKQALTGASSALKAHGEGVWRHLEPKLEYLANNWWEVLKETAWNLIWPWPAVGKDLSQIWDHVKSAASNLWNLRFSKVVDDILAIERGVISIAGNLYGWFFIAAVLIGAILGGIFGVGAGAIPGAAAGLEVAVALGEGLVAATVVVEAASIAKSIYNLQQPDENEDDKEKDYEQIASSGLTLAITGVMFILGEIAVKFAQGLLSRVAPLFRRFRGKAPKVEVEPPKVEPPKTEAPEVEGGRGGEPPPEGRIVAKEPTIDGKHEIEVTEKGEVLICTDCALLKRKYAQELADPSNASLKGELEAAEKLSDPIAKAKEEARIEHKLRPLREDTLSLDPQTKTPNPKSREEARSILQAEDQGLIQGYARRPDLSKGEPNLDFVLDDANGKTMGYADIKTPVDPQLNPIVDQASDIAGKIGLYDPDVKVIIELKNLSLADKAIFKAELVKNGADIIKIIFLND